MATTIRVWDGYVSTVDELVRWVTFDGERLGGIVYKGDGNSRFSKVERIFYQASDGKAVVHEVRFGKWDGGYAYDQSFLYIYANIGDMYENIGVSAQDIDPTCRNVNALRIEPFGTHKEMTLNEYITEFGICTTHPFA
jgi:hypothetical protein